MRSFHVLTFACVLTGVGIVPVRTGGVFVADVFLPVALPRTEHMPPRQDMWSEHACAVCDK